MRAYELQPEGSKYALALVDRPARPLEAHQVVVRVKACSLNYRDLINIGNLAGRNVAGRIPVSDGAGEVVEVGQGVTRVKPGDRVCGIFFQTWLAGRFELRHHQSDLGGTIDGMLAEEVVLHEDGLVKFPDYLSFEEAATLPCAAVTAWYSLVTRGDLQPGSSVLAIGTGGVSIFALQFAKAMGANVYITSSSDDKLKRATELGAVAAVNYKATPAWDKEIWKLTGKRGVDHVVEVGGPGTLDKSIACVAAGGQIALIGVLTGFGAPQGSLFPLVARNVRLDGIYVGAREHFEAMNAFLEAKQIHPVIDRVFPFEEAEASYKHLEGGSHFGKVVIRVSP